MLAICTAIIVALMLWRWYARNDRKVKAANNAVGAKLTFMRITEKERMSVLARSESIKRRLWGGVPSVRFNEVQELLLMSLAMRELRVPCALRYKKDWHIVRDPFMALRPDSRILQMVAQIVGESEGIDLSIDPKDYFAETVLPDSAIRDKKAAVRDKQ